MLGMTASRDQKTIFTPKGEGQHEKSLIDLFMKRAEVEAMAEAIRRDRSVEGERFRFLFFVLVNFGVRISEAAQLRRSNFAEISSNIVRVHRLKKRRESASGFRRQSRSIMDFILINDRERKCLARLLEQLHGDKIFPFTVRTGQLLFGHFLRVAGLRSVYTPHCLRRFVQSEMDEAGIAPVASKARLGHALDTNELYKASPDRLAKEIEKWKPIEV